MKSRQKSAPPIEHEEVKRPIARPVPALPIDRLIGLEEVKRLTNRGRSIIYKMMREKTFPQRCAAGWSEREIQEWISQQLQMRRAA